MRTLLQKFGASALAMLGIGQAYAAHFGASWDVDTIKAHVGDEISFNDFAFTEIVEVKSSDNSVAEVVNDSIYIRTSYYNGQGMYEQKSAQLMLISSKADTFVSVLNVAPEARLSEAKTYTNPTDLQMESIEFTRTFKDNSVNTWQTIYLPFAIDIEAHADEFSVARLYGYDNVRDTNKDGIVGKGDSLFVIQKIATSGVTRPNEPLLISPKHAGEITFRAADNILAAAKNDTIRLADTIVSAAKRVYEIVCSYNVDTLKPGDNNYYVAASGKFSRVTKAPTGYYPYRWYFHADSKVVEVFESIDASGLKMFLANANFETAKKIETVVVNAGEEFDVDKFCYYVNCTPLVPLSSIESSDESVAWIENGAVHAVKIPYDGHGNINDSNRSCKLTLRTEYGSVTVVNFVVKPNTAKLSEAKTYTNPERMHFDTIEFTRTFKANSVDTWQTIYLPFAFDIEQHSYDFSVARYFGCGPVRDTNGDGVINDRDSSFVVFRKAADGVTNPNEPLLVSPKYAGDITIRANYDYNSSSEFLYPAERKIIDVKDTTDRTFQIVCTYDVDTLKAGDNNYYVAASGKFSRVTKAPTGYYPYRWYFHIDSKVSEVFESIDASGLKMFLGNTNFEFPKQDTIPVIGDDTTDVLGGDTTVLTSIKLIESDNIREQVIYTNRGVRIQSLDNAPAGVYIVNGKKVLINKNK